MIFKQILSFIIVVNLIYIYIAIGYLNITNYYNEVPIHSRADLKSGDGRLETKRMTRADREPMNAHVGRSHVGQRGNHGRTGYPAPSGKEMPNLGTERETRRWMGESGAQGNDSSATKHND